MNNASSEADTACAGSVLRVAVIIPCFNEEAAIAEVVTAFREVLPTARVYVYDNNCTDRTAQEAAVAGAITRTERRQGKGYVVRRMFADVEADIYVLVDGDGTYEPAVAPRLLQTLVDEGLDMVTCVRRALCKASYRRGHRFGNRALSTVVGGIFHAPLRDMLSGYRVLSRRFVKSFPVESTGFEIETELTIHALSLGMPISESTANYRARASGSHSKLRTLSDGIRILWIIFELVRQERPLVLFGLTGLALAITSVVLAYPLLVTYLETGLVPRLPTAVLSTAIMLLSFLSFTCGLILDTVTKGRREAKRLSYFGTPGVLGRLEEIETSSTHRVSPA